MEGASGCERLCVIVFMPEGAAESDANVREHTGREGPRGEGRQLRDLEVAASGTPDSLGHVGVEMVPRPEVSVGEWLALIEAA